MAARDLRSPGGPSYQRCGVACFTRLLFFSLGNGTLTDAVASILPQVTQDEMVSSDETPIARI